MAGIHPDDFDKQGDSSSSEAQFRVAPGPSYDFSAGPQQSTADVHTAPSASANSTATGIGGCGCLVMAIATLFAFAVGGPVGGVIALIIAFLIYKAAKS